MKDIGKKIRDLRESKGMTQEELAHKVGYKSRASINKIELSRDVPLNKLAPIAAALDVTPSFLAGWDDDIDPDISIILPTSNEDMLLLEKYKNSDSTTKEIIRKILGI